MPDFRHNLSFEPAASDSPQVKGFQEVVFSVSNLEQASRFYQKMMGWQRLYSGESQAQVRFWELPHTVKMEEIVLNNPNDQAGFLRLVKFHHIPQIQIRSSGHPWDTGGIFDVNSRTLNLNDTFQAFQAAGWIGLSDPVRFQFKEFDVSEVALQGPDGIVIATMQRHSPPLEGFPNLKKMSHFFNSTHITKDMEAAYDFFINKLGFQVVAQVDSLDQRAGRNVLGLPFNINAQVKVPICITNPTGANFGSVEFLSIEGLEGEDFSARAIPPNLGILMLRFPVSDAAAYANLIAERGVDIHIPVQELEIAPYGKLKVFAIRSPDGVWLEFLEKI